MEDKRKQLYPVANDARKNLENKVRLVRDKLFINHKPYIPEGQTIVKSRDTMQRSARNYENGNFRFPRNRDTYGNTQFNQYDEARAGYKPYQTQWSRTFNRRPQTQNPANHEQNDFF